MFTSQHIADQIALFNNAGRLRHPAFALIDSLQKSRRQPGEQILTLAVTLVAMCESANLNFNDVVTKAVRVMRDVEGPFTSHLQAVRQYAVEQIRLGGR